jgi:orotate phosphoribosyltransferase
MRHDLWPEAESHAPEIARFFAGKLTMPLEVLLAVDESGAVVGFVELSIRPYVDGCATDRVAYLEGWYVVPDRRGRGIGRALVDGAEEWARSKGCSEFGSDALLDNDISRAAHLALGFEETEQIRYFRKALPSAEPRGGRSAMAAAEFLALVDGRRGHFRMESGYHGRLWLELDALFAEPRRLEPFVDTLCAALRPYSIDVACGALVGGAFLAQLVARSLNVEYCYTKPVVTHDPDRLFPVSYELPDACMTRVAGRRVAMLDDVMSAGSALRGTYAALVNASAAPVVAGALMVLGTTGIRFFAQQGVPVEAAVRDDFESWVPSECPLCAAGVPLEEPTL